jgi:radical SAM-linked protein
MRVRFRFAKLGKIRFTSQRDVARMWERALRRAELPLAYSEGFSPRAQLSFGLALPTGCESLAEYVDVAIDGDRPGSAAVDVDSLPAQLSVLLPDGIEVEGAAEVERSHGSLQQLVTSCSWVIGITGLSRAQLEERVRLLLAAPSVPITRERKGRQESDDLRPSVLALAVCESPEPSFDSRSDDSVALAAELGTQPRGVRPVELIRGLIAVSGATGGEVSPEAAGAGDGSGEVPVLGRACRTQQWIERDGIREEPLERRGDTAGVDRAAHALERAS